MASKSVSTSKSSVPAIAAKTPAGKKAPAKKTTVKAPAAKPPAKPPVNASAKKRKPADKKQKMIRDSFNMPADDYALIGALKKRAIASGREIKKSELLRAGLKALAAMTEAAFGKAVAAVPAIKTGRPVKKRK